ncbi:3-dehydroquinate synthase [Vallitalea okinawensis]|uniref:3-dehydroquinate synthase n=1 Tax=Vallitalea okinawensis TaxID=2078660 RepID=UPI000CFCB732|nr:3-dehydroquinate synthase [Vallitalea okinawensis]
MSIKHVLPVNTGHNPYKIYIEKSFDMIPELLKEHGYGHSRKIGIITDSNVKEHQLKNLLEVLKGFNCFVFSFQAGEKSKNFNTIQQLYTQLVENEFDRHCCLLALGGGVVGDLTGFVAATYMRGMGYIQIPTSLLAQVDSAVGGKTGYDFMGYKNMIGAFYQPHFVYTNLSTLRTLPVKEFNAGMAEVIKHGIIQDESYYKFLVEKKEAIKDLNNEALTKMVKESCAIKANVVSIDEKEMGLREILNFGHTLGHAIESVYHFDYLHGECVALGMIGALYMSYELGYIIEETLLEAKSLISYFNLPSTLSDLDMDKVYKALFHDKKVKEGKVKFILSKGIGSVYTTSDIQNKLIMDALKYLKGVA